jgi:hypothetical protein
VLGTISITRLDTDETHEYPADTFFEAFRKEFYRKSIAPQRESVNLTNIAGEATLATEGLWRREQVEFSQGAGQYSLDRKGEDSALRFFTSKGVDVFTYPQRATLLPDTYQLIANTNSDLLATKCGDYLVVAGGGTVIAYNSSYSAIQTYSAGTTYGGTAWTHVYSITSNDTYCYIATDTGLWFAKIGTDTQFQLFAAPDAVTGYTGGYSLVRWANDQLIAAQNARLYAFQPRAVSGGEGSGLAPYGSPPSVINPGANAIPIVEIVASGTYSTVTTSSPHQLVVGQRIAITKSENYQSIFTAPTLSSGVLTITTTSAHGFQAGESVDIDLFFNGAPSGRRERTTIQSVPSATTFTYNTTKVGSAILATGFTSGWVQAANIHNNYGYNANWTVASVTGATTFTITAAAATYGNIAWGGYVTNPAQATTYVPDVLITHENPNWVWSDATGGQTQVYFAGYVQSATGKYGGQILRSDMLGSSTSSSNGLQAIASASVSQPWMLDTPLVALPMAPDEYPTTLKAYLNYIFIGTNRGVRMAQTLSIYDPTATATGDLKAGPLIPNNLQPVTTPVTAIVGDGRYVWFTWNNYDGTSTGLGKLNLQEFIHADPLAPVYASDIMVTGQGTISSLVWDPINNVPLMAVAGLGVYGPYATNAGGNMTATQYVTSGNIVSSYFDYGIAEEKIPVYFDYGVYLPETAGVAQGTCSASVVMDPLSASPLTLTIPSFTSNSQAIEQPVSYPSPTQDRGRQFQTTVTLTTSNPAKTPTLFRWTLKAWPTPVQGTDISAVVSLFTKDSVDSRMLAFDPDAEYYWLESLRWNQTRITYTAGQLSVNGVIYLINDIPHKAVGDYKGGFEGSMAIQIKTIGPFIFTPAPTS